ncbi:MAG: putative alpha/beta-fold hydrolase [Pseudohongiellaceae bacterium]|jgi:predicted alpha/beta-fold hydrolase
MSFHPPRFLRNRHVQSILASSKLRKLFSKKTAKRLDHASRDVLLPSGGQIHLHCLVTEHSRQKIEHTRPLVILIHGWEGSANSTYLHSAAATLFDNGYDIIRLHLRDHGPSHHLNTELFHGARIDEVVAAIKSINQQFPRQNTYLTGFSLGGNFALRIAQRAKNDNLKLTKVVAISPVINPIETMKALENGSALYRTYFMRKWRKSLVIKHATFPEKVKLAEVKNATNLMALTEMLVEQHTNFTSVNDYFNSYTLTGTQLSEIEIPTEIITSQDDPVIPIADFNTIIKSANVNIQIHAYGGHCGFIKNYGLESWVNEELLRQFKTVE